jgi:putative ATP-binding cassette transporter
MRAIAGVWPWGRGSVKLPKGRIAFMPQKPYFPLGTLREAMLYPENPEGIDDEGLREALHKVGLDHLRGGSTRPSAGITSCRAANSNAWPSPGC